MISHDGYFFKPVISDSDGDAVVAAPFAVLMQDVKECAFSPRDPGVGPSFDNDP